MKKRLTAVVAAAVLCVGLLAGCAGGNNQKSAQADQGAKADKIEVVCATFPAYDWVTQVVGDKADDYDITYLMGSGVDLHSYQPTVEDIAKISDADLFVFVGGESDGWAEDAVKAAANPNLRTVNMLETVGDAAVEEEVVEGMQAESDEHEHEHGDADHDEDADHEGDDHEAADHEGHDHDAEEGPEYDEHVWLSLRNAQVLVDAIADALSGIDAANAANYAANAKAYDAKLADLDAQYSAAVKAGAKNTVVFADRFPFRYLVDDYDLNYYAAFVGCSAETEASFETVAFLAKKVDELGLKDVFVIENSDEKIARTVIASTQGKNQEILVMDSLQSTTDADVAAGKTYLSAMEDNLAALKTALA